MSKLRAEIKQQKPFSSLAEETYLNLQRTADSLLADEAALLAEHGLTSAQYNVLRILRGAGAAGHPCQEIGARLISRVPDVTRLLDRLERARLVQRTRATDDRRVVRVHILPAALDLLQRLDRPVLDLHDRRFAALSERQLKTLNSLLVRAREAT